MKRLTPAIAIIVIAASLSACGRRGPLEPPPGAVVNNAAQSTAVEPAVDDNPFILDSLI